MKKHPNLNNKTYEEFLATLPPSEQKIMNRLRAIVRTTAPELTEKFSYGVPYYFGKARVCFIWPPSAPIPGFDEGVILGFCKGNLLSNEQGILEGKGRKQIATVLYSSVKQVKEHILKEIILEALLIDELYSSGKK